jgi:hypothetical protein
LWGGGGGGGARPPHQSGHEKGKKRIWTHNQLGWSIRGNTYRIILLISFTRAKIGEGKKSLEEVMDWYNRINTDTLYYVTYSIPDSDVSDFYRWIIGKT